MGRVRVASMNVPQGTCGFSSPGVCLTEAVKCVAPSCVGSAGARQDNAAQVRKSGCLPRWACLLGMNTDDETSGMCSEYASAQLGWCFFQEIPPSVFCFPSAGCLRVCLLKTPQIRILWFLFGIKVN